MNPENKKIIDLLENTAQSIKPNIVFEHELEKRLTAAHKPKRDPFASLRRNIFPTLGWAAGLIILVFALNWVTRSLLSGTPAAGDGFICPVTEPNGSLPPNETVASVYYLGNGELWTSLWPDGKVIMEEHNLEADGSFSMKWGWVRAISAISGPLTIEGHRLDADAEPLRAYIPDGYGDTGFQVSALIFPTTGCWEVTGRVGDASLTFVTEVIFNGATATPQANIDIVPTPQVDESNTPQGEAHDWNGSTLYLNTSLPEETPAEMKIYLARDEVRASVEEVLALADLFKMKGKIYETVGELPDTTDYIVIDGNRQLRVRSDRYYSYYPNYAEYSATLRTSINPNAKALVNEFLQTYGFNGSYQMDQSNPYITVVLPTTPDGFVIREDNYMMNGLMFNFNENGIISVNASLLKYNETATVGIISAQEAFDRLLTPAPLYESKMSITPAPAEIDVWLREYPLDKTITYYGWLTSTAKSVEGGAAYISLNNYPVSGNVDGINENLPNTFIKTVGQFHETNGVQSFEMESWKIYEGSEESYLGTVQRENDSVVITTLDGLSLNLPDAPNDLPLPAKDIYVSGVRLGDVFEWKTMTNGPMGGGGGGGGGLGFFKLNLSGTPIPLPTLQPTPTPEPQDTTPIEGLRGIVSVNIFEKADGTRYNIYNFMAGSADHLMVSYYTLEGDLQELEKYHNRPVDIWGKPELNSDGQIMIKVDRYEIPYPDLQFQLMTGFQKLVTLEDQPATLVTLEDGTQYAQLYSDGSTGNSLIGSEEDKVNLEVLVIPGETFGGYPAIRLFGGGLAVDPLNGQPIEYTLSVDEPYIIPEPVQRTDYSLTIEKVELVYYTPDQRYAGSEPAAEPPYLQPVWRFYGHYSNGDEFEFLMQAVKDEYLLPTHINEP